MKDCTEFAKNIMLTLKCFNSTLISMVDYSEAGLMTLLHLGKGVRMRASLHSSPERFIDALIIYFLNANSVMSGKRKAKDRFLALLEMTVSIKLGRTGSSV